MFTFKDLQDEVKRRAVRDQGGSNFDIAIKNIINTSLFRISKEALWRSLRRKATITTKGSYTTGSGNGSFTNGSTSVNISAANFYTGEIEIGRRIKLSGDGNYHIIDSISSQENLTLRESYSGTSTNSGTYEILGQEEYNLPLQVGHRCFMWHEEYGYPFLLNYVPDFEFYKDAWDNTAESIPTNYRMWNEDMVISQVKTASNIRVVSSSASDTSQEVTVFGVVSGYPQSETIRINGLTVVSSTNLFSSIERVVKSATTVGRLTVSSDSGNNTIAVIPVGDITGGVKYTKVQLYPLPSSAYKINVQYYKEPYRLVNDNDIHELGQDFDEAIILLAVSKIKYENNQQEGNSWYSLYQDEIRNLRKNNADKIDWFPTLNRSSVASGDYVCSNLLYRQVGVNYGPSSR